MESTMSRISGHRKSQSTSALSAIAAGNPRQRSKQPDLPPVPSHPSHISHTSRASSSSRTSISTRPESRTKKGSLESVHEEDQHAGISNLPGLNDRRSSIVRDARVDPSSPGKAEAEVLKRMEDVRKRKSSLERAAAARKVDANEEFVEKVKGWLKDIVSLRSSPRRRLAGLENFEKLLIGCCLDEDLRSSALPSLLKLNAHTLLLSLLMRHAATLTARAHSTGHSALGPSDELVLPLIPEFSLCIAILQGLCLMDARAKSACGEAWTLEMFIDLLLLLRTQQAPKQDDKPVVYSILELMLAVLVDSPSNSRTFEKLQGLEAVMRVLKGTGVIKDVRWVISPYVADSRMKCIEFIYFWLQPEEAAQNQRSVSGSSTASTSSVESAIYPPSPLDSSTSSTSSRLSTPSLSSAHLSPSPSSNPKYQVPRMGSPTGWKDIDIPFIPQTPRKPPQPTLGYLTPSNRRVSAGNKSTPGLPTVPGSPVVDFTGGEQEDGTPRAGRGGTSPAVGLGFGLPHADAKSPVIKRDVTAVRLSAITDSPDPFDSKLLSPRKTPSKGIARSNTQPSLTIIQSSPREGRRVSASSRRLSKSPLTIPPSNPDSPPPMPASPLRKSSLESDQEAPPKEIKTRMRHSKTQSLSLAAMAESSSSASMGPPPPLPRPSSRMRHSRTQSHMSHLVPEASSTQPIPALPPMPSRASTAPEEKGPSRQSSSSSTGSTGTVKRVPSDEEPAAGVPAARHRMSMGPPSSINRTPSKAKRGFPAELTKGLPPSSSSPALSSLASPALSSFANTTAGTGALLARKRVPSGHRASMPPTPESRRAERAAQGREKEKEPKVRSMEEKKEMVSIPSPPSIVILPMSLECAHDSSAHGLEMWTHWYKASKR